jgi:Transposase
MRRRFTREQIIGFLRQAQGGVPVKELCRKHGFSDAGSVSGRMSQRSLVRKSDRRANPDFGVATRLQRAATAQRIGLPHAGRIRNTAPREAQIG